MSAWVATKAATIASEHRVPGPIAMQVEYSLLARKVEAEHNPAAREGGMSVMLSSPLAGGAIGKGQPRLHSRYRSAQWRQSVRRQQVHGPQLHNSRHASGGRVRALLRAGTGGARLDHNTAGGLLGPCRRADDGTAKRQRPGGKRKPERRPHEPIERCQHADPRLHLFARRSHDPERALWKT